MTFAGHSQPAFAALLKSAKPAEEAPKESLSYIQKASVAFWDAYLKNNTLAKQYLLGHELNKSSHDVVLQKDR